MNNLLINPQIRTLTSLIDDIKKGNISVPPFQRDFVWTREKIRELFKSIQQNYPIGSILLWKPDKRYEWTQNRTIGKYELLNQENGDVYILDGYQRLSSIFSCLVSPNSTMKYSQVDSSLFDLYYDLSDESFIYLRSANSRKPYQVPLYVFMSTSEFRKYARTFVEPHIMNATELDVYLDRADELSRKLIDYQLTCVEIKGADIEEAVDIFSRLNSKGEEISMDWMVNALSYKFDFRFADVMDELIGWIADNDFGVMKRDTVFRCFQSSFGKIFFDQRDVDKLARRSDFKEKIFKSVESIKRAILFLKNDLRMPNCKFLPYGNQLIFLMEFFNYYPNPTEPQKTSLETWFWKATYSNYFTICSLTDQRKAYEHFIDCLRLRNLTDLFYLENNMNPLEILPFPKKIQLGAVRSLAVCLFIERFMPEIIENEAHTKRTNVFYDKILGQHKNSIKHKEQSFVEWLGFQYKS